MPRTSTGGRLPAPSPSAPPITDAQLIARVLVNDDRHAFAELVRRHQAAVRACLRRLTTGNDALADDLAQETFILAWRNLKSFRQEARFSTWLYRVAVNSETPSKFGRQDYYDPPETECASRRHI